MILAVTNEADQNERRVALTPDVVTKLVKQGFEVQIETKAGEQASFHDLNYQEAGAEIITDWPSPLGKADILLKVGCPKERNGKQEIDFLREGAVLIGLLNPFDNLNLVKRFAERKLMAFALELVPRISRAQSMDALSSQAAVAGYKAVLMAASIFGKFFPMLTTAAGTIIPAKVLVIGVGVAGLQAIATARRLGALVEAFDIRPETKQEVESLGAKFIEDKDLASHIRQSDVVVTAAQVPGKKAPRIVKEEMLIGMKEGSVILDMAAEQGGNCALTQTGKTIVHNGITIMGPVNLPSMMPVNASQMIARNLSAFVLSIVKDGKLHLDLNDEVIKSTLVTYEGEIVNEAFK